MLDAEVVVVGAGPGGCAAALGLARAGHDVWLVDRATFPRDKVCGEGLMPYGVSELEALGVSLEIDAQPFVGIGYRVGDAFARGLFPNGRTGLGVRRKRLDRALNDACRMAGVRVAHGMRVGRVGGNGRTRTVEVDGRTIRCRAVVAADGMRSSIRSQLGLTRASRGRPRYGVRGHVRLADADRQIDTVEVHATGGLEYYLTPVGQRELNVAVLLERDRTKAFKGDLQSGFNDVLQSSSSLRTLLDGSVPDGPVALTGPLRQEATDIVDEGIVLVGDAAGFLDGITGEGMSLTLVGARLASEELSAALKAGDVSKRRLSRYRVRRARAARDLSWLTEVVLAGIRRPWLAERFVRGLARHPDVFERVLGVSTGGSLFDVRLRDLVRVLR